MVRRSDVLTGWVGGGGGAKVPAWPPSPESCTCFRKPLPLISSPSGAAKPRFLVKVIEMERNCLNAYRNFSLRGLMSVEYDSNSQVTEGFDLSFWSLAEEKPHCKRPKGQPVDCPISGQWTPRAGCKKGASRTVDAQNRVQEGGKHTLMFPPAHPPRSWQSLHRDFLAQRPYLCFCV